MAGKQRSRKARRAQAGGKGKKAGKGPAQKQTAARAPSRAMRPVAAATAYSRGQVTGQPRVQGSASSVRIRHRELVGSVLGGTTTAFQLLSSYPLNPGMSLTFPWLSTQAPAWERYKFHKLKFCYYSRCATTTVGSIMLAPDYDPADPAPASEQVASTFQNAVEEVPWTEEFCCELNPVDMLGGMQSKYTRSLALLPNLDIKTYDSGNLFVISTDSAGANAWGKLWVEYDCELFVPQAPQYLGSVQSLIVNVAGGTIGTGNLFGSAPTHTGTLPVIFLGNQIQFPQPGNYFVIWEPTGTGYSETSAALSPSPGMTYSQDLNSGAANGTTAAIYLFEVNVTLANATMTVSVTGDWTTITGGYARVFQYQVGLG